MPCTQGTFYLHLSICLMHSSLHTIKDVLHWCLRGPGSYDLTMMVQEVFVEVPLRHHSRLSCQILPDRMCSWSCHLHLVHQCQSLGSITIVDNIQDIISGSWFLSTKLVTGKCWQQRVLNFNRIISFQTYQVSQVCYWSSECPAVFWEPCSGCQCIRIDWQHLQPTLLCLQTEKSQPRSRSFYCMVSIY